MNTNRLERVAKKRLLLNLQEIGMLVVLIVMSLILSVVSPDFLQVHNLLNVLKQITVIAILSAGMTFVILTGGIDLSVGSTVALAGVSSVMLSTSGVNPVVSMLAGVLVGFIVGAMNGALVAYGKIPSFIVTLGAYTWVRGLAYVLSGGYPTTLKSDLFKFIGSGDILSIPTPIYIMLIIYIIAFIILKYTNFGRNVYAIGGNEEAARLTGLNVQKNNKRNQNERQCFLLEGQ
jgi:ribose transport system permease protein